MCNRLINDKKNFLITFQDQCTRKDSFVALQEYMDGEARSPEENLNLLLKETDILNLSSKYLFMSKDVFFLSLIGDPFYSG